MTRKNRKAHKNLIIKKSYIKNKDNKEKHEKVKARMRERHYKNRLRVLNHYGGKCACCGENRYEFLALDHINGGGSQHRRQIKGGSKHMTQWVINNGFPKDMFRILCHNCNMAIGAYGYCPHTSPSLSKSMNLEIILPTGKL